MGHPPSVRFLTDSTGAVTDTYDYDAFGNLINQTGSTPNNYLFAGEQYDPALGLYYNRARYLNTTTGRFWSMDTYDGDDASPLSLHKYLYAVSSPVSLVDPSGREFFSDLLSGLNVQLTMYALAFPTAAKVLGVAIDALAPVELQLSTPNFSLASQSGLSVLTAGEELAVVAREYTLKGAYARLGTGFEEFIGKIIPAGFAQQVRILNGAIWRPGDGVLGTAIADFVSDTVVLEAKLTAKSILRNTNQIEQLAKFSRTTGRTLEYVFLTKPSASEVDALLDVIRSQGQDIQVEINWLFSKL